MSVTDRSVTSGLGCSVRAAVKGVALAATAGATLAFAAGPAGGASASPPASVSIQIDNPDRHTVIRVTLDGTQVFEGLPVTSTMSNIPLLTSTVGPFELHPGTHTLVAEALGARVKGRLDWMPTPGTTSWVVIHYVPTASESPEPSHMRFSLQPRTYKLR